MMPIQHNSIILTIHFLMSHYSTPNIITPLPLFSHCPTILARDSRSYRPPQDLRRQSSWTVFQRKKPLRYQMPCKRQLMCMTGPMSPFPLHTFHSTLSTLHSVLVLHTPHSTLHTPHFSLTVYTWHSPHSHSTLHTSYSTFYTPHSTHGSKKLTPVRGSPCSGDYVLFAARPTGPCSGLSLFRRCQGSAAGGGSP